MKIQRNFIENSHLHFIFWGQCKVSEDCGLWPFPSSVTLSKPHTNSSYDEWHAAVSQA